MYEDNEWKQKTNKEIIDPKEGQVLPITDVSGNNGASGSANASGHNDASGNNIASGNDDASGNNTNPRASRNS